MGDAALALLAGLILGSIVAFRRARGVLTPEARRAVAREGIAARTRWTTATALTVGRAAVGVAALAGIVWLTWQLFT